MRKALSVTARQAKPRTDGTNTCHHHAKNLLQNGKVTFSEVEQSCLERRAVLWLGCEKTHSLSEAGEEGLNGKQDRGL